jgi:carboxyl-terminal processing protease
MKNVFLFFFIFHVVCCAGQGKRNIKQEMNWLRNSLSQHHVSPKIIDDSFSSDVFDKLLQDLDPDKIFFTQADVSWIEPFRNLLDDEINGKSIGFLLRLQERYRSGLIRSEGLIKGILDSPIDWKTPEMYHPGPAWAKDEESLSERHRQWLKYQILDRLTEMMQRDSLLDVDFFKRNISDALVYV